MKKPAKKTPNKAVKEEPSRRKIDKIRKILKLTVKLDDIRDTESLNALRNEIIKILMEIK